MRATPTKIVSCYQASTRIRVSPLPRPKKIRVFMKRFTHRNESFQCVVCGLHVPPAAGTCRNHCPSCLTSLHVDVFPGDRAEQCKGIMDAISAEISNGKTVLTHRCRTCGEIRKCKRSVDDTLDAVISLLSVRQQHARKRRTNLRIRKQHTRTAYDC
jgi:predicted RNA-binding Zn-ribbon protein involved in translation (DUF1610 family)